MEGTSKRKTPKRGAQHRQYEVGCASRCNLCIRAGHAGLRDRDSKFYDFTIHKTTRTYAQPV